MSSLLRSLLCPTGRFTSGSFLRYQTRGKAVLTSPGAIPYVITETPTYRKSLEQSRLRKRLLTRPGLVGIKRGMVPFFTPEGNQFVCTVLEIDQVEVIHNKTIEKDGYPAVQVGCGYKLNNQSKPMLGHFSKAKVSPKEYVTEFHLKDESGLIPPGTLLTASHFEVGKFVDLQSVSKGKGTAGVMKRWGFKGLKATHGVSKAHRSAGSTGQNQTPGRVLPGKKMAGRMGQENVTIQNVEVLDVNEEKGYILVKGPVAGANGSYVKIQDAKKIYH